MVKSTKKNKKNNESKHKRLSLKKVKGGAPEEQPKQSYESKLQEVQNIMKEFNENYNNKKKILDNKIQKIQELKTDNNEHLLDYISKRSEYDYLHCNLYRILHLINKQHNYNDNSLNNNDANVNDIEEIKKYIERVNILIKNNDNEYNGIEYNELIKEPQKAEEKLNKIFNVYDKHLNNILEHTREKLNLVKKKMNDIDKKLNETNKDLNTNHYKNLHDIFPAPPTELPQKGGSQLMKSFLHKFQSGGKRKNKKNNTKRKQHPKRKNRKNRTKKKY